MSGGSGGRNAAARARPAARLLAVLGCVLTAEAQVGTGGTVRRGGTAGSVAGQGCPPAVGRAAEPSRSGSRAETGGEVTSGSHRGEGSFGPCHGSAPRGEVGECLIGVCSPRPSPSTPCGWHLPRSSPGPVPPGEVRWPGNQR